MLKAVEDFFLLFQATICVCILHNFKVFVLIGGGHVSITYLCKYKVCKTEAQDPTRGEEVTGSCELPNLGARS